MEKDGLFRRVFELTAAPIFVLSVDTDGSFIFVNLNPACEKAFGLHKEDLIGKRLEEISDLRPKDADALRTSCRRCLETNDTIQCKDSFFERGLGTRWLTQLTPVRDEAGRIIQIVGSALDITSLIKSENVRSKAQAGLERRVEDRTAELRQINQQLAKEIDERKQAERETENARRRLDSTLKFITTIISAIPIPLFYKDREGRYLGVNNAFAELMGFTPDYYKGKTVMELWPSDLAQVYHNKDLELMNHPARQVYEFKVMDKNGVIHPAIWSKDVFRDENGEVAGIVGAFQDISERVRAEEEKEKLTIQLMQAQKMESIGQLAGGVAHDFNNMLGVIQGYAELALMQVAPSSPLHARIQEIIKAAQRSADLTRKLLAFARKQTIAPKVLNLNDTVSSMLKMLRRLIGEDINLVWMPGAELWSVNMDPSQIDQVLANLCVNARDAIAGVGKVTIETGNANFDKSYCANHAGFIPGEFVLLAVSDDGCGMDQETQSHLFEPFFTTKGLDQGTGLGLATVYGIVKQNDGFINVYSELGHGTTFKIYLPRNKGKLTRVLMEKTTEVPRGGGEIILMVEDEEAMLDLGKTILEKLGYTVLIARSPSEAIRLTKEFSGVIHLLLTDVIMPEMTGRELAGRITSILPGINCLYMSGYTANVIAHRGVLEEGVHFIQKPFSVQDLAAKIREVLDQKSTNSH